MPISSYERAKPLLQRAEAEVQTDKQIRSETNAAIADLLPGMTSDERAQVTETIFEIGQRDPKRFEQLGSSSPAAADQGAYAAAGAGFVYGEAPGHAERDAMEKLLSEVIADGGLDTDELTRVWNAARPLLVASARPEDDVTWIRETLGQLKNDDAKSVRWALENIKRIAKASTQLKAMPPGDLSERKDVRAMLAGIIGDDNLEDGYVPAVLRAVTVGTRALLQASSQPLEDFAWVRDTLNALGKGDPLTNALSDLDHAARARAALLLRPAD